MFTELFFYGATYIGETGCSIKTCLSERQSCVRSKKPVVVELQQNTDYQILFGSRNIETVIPILGT